MNITWKNCFRVCISLFILYLAIFYWSSVSTFLSLLLGALSPLVLGFTIAYVLNILMRFYERHNFPHYATQKAVKATKRPVCLIGSVVTLLAIIALVVWLVVPELVSCVSLLVSEIPKGIEKLVNSQWVRRVLPQNALAQLSSVDWMSYISKGIQVVTSGLGDAITTVVSAVSSVFSAVVSAVLGAIFALYMLLSKEKLQQHGTELFIRYGTPHWREKTHHVLSVLNRCFRNFIVGQCIEAVILGVLCALGMWIFGFPYATMIGALVGFTALIPVVGAFIGAGVGVIMILTVSPVKALLFLVFIVVLQQLEGNLIYPKVVGSSIGLPSLLVLAAITVGGSLMGILGMLIGVPMVAALYQLLKEVVKKEKNKKAEDSI
ncbi:MAG: AI-2E family transporter [Clostridia bacterium]|nr:AI-2E family transporter [Clostridia bacterium]